MKHLTREADAVKALERLKIRLLVWIMIALRLRPRALHGFDAAKLVQEERDDPPKR